ncbi:TIR domain-containing protein [Massilia sp. DWR3-1-1]|uniref:TIR domain-containing protein n=1 Tax=Massilia sp. DWR3-1-1 TaxID=2804559 RepID=UPI003CEB9C45
MRIFIGSSSQAVATGDLGLVSDLLKAANFTPCPWTAPEAFLPGVSTWENLLKMLDDVDAAAFVFREDDYLHKDSHALPLIRDNVLLEFGLFSGRLGPSRCVFFKKGEPKLPEDLKGITWVALEDGPQTMGTLVKWREAMEAREADPKNLSALQIETIVKAMSSTDITPDNIMLLMRKLGVNTSDVNLALRGQLAAAATTAPTLPA